ncbi:MAG: hypothetical protein LBF16_02525 [Pseudomonadales bacterium]|jgi:hypothetical protein|nr:hypothetical protein [Pseudomonadales bacterium]
MKNLIARLSVGILCSSIAAITSAADFTETLSSQYCVKQTSVRGDYANLIIDHNLTIAPEDRRKTGDIYVAARFKKSGEWWLLGDNMQWRKANSEADLRSAARLSYAQLPPVVPVQVFYDPADIRSVAGDGEIWVGYGLRKSTESLDVSFAEMVAKQRYNLLWEAPPQNMDPELGVRIDQSTTLLCFDISDVTNTFSLATPLK